MDVRVGDAERRQAVATLQRHYVDGRLTAEELEERIGRTLAARTTDQLVAPQRDLPRLDAAPVGSRRRDRGLRAHATSYLMVMALLVTIWLLTTPGGYFWPIWPMLGWGIGLASHAVGAGKGGRRTGS